MGMTVIKPDRQVVIVRPNGNRQVTITIPTGFATAAQAANATTVAAAGAVMDSDIAEAEGFVRKTGAGSYEALKTNLNASVAPTATDDSGDGYAVGSVWIDTTADKTYICVDATATASVWQDLSAGAPLITSDNSADDYPQAFVDYMISSNRAATLPSHAVTTPAGTYPGSNAFYGGVILSDGRVFCVPFNTTSARIYDPATNTLTTPAGTYPGSGAFIGGVLLPDGRVFFVPSNSTSARITAASYAVHPGKFATIKWGNKL